MCRYCGSHAAFLLFIYENLEKEFGARKMTEVVEEFAGVVAQKKEAEIESVAKKMFGDYGERLMKRALELGEKSIDEFLDYFENLEKRDLPPWFIETAYISIQPLFFQLDVVKYDPYNFIFRIDKCPIFNEIEGKCSAKVTNRMPCKYACLTASETAYRNLDLKASVSMDASMAKDGYCQFAAKNLEV